MKNCPSSKLVGREECGHVHLMLGGHRLENSDMPPWLRPRQSAGPGILPPCVCMRTSGGLIAFILLSQHLLVL